MPLDTGLGRPRGPPPHRRADVGCCRCAKRCPWATGECREGAPPLEQVGEADHYAGCVRWDEMETLAAEYLEDKPTSGADSRPVTGDSE